MPKLTRRDILILLSCIDIYSCDYYYDNKRINRLNKTKLKLLKRLAALNEAKAKK